MVEKRGENLLAFIHPEQWTSILNRFSEVLGIDIYTVDPDGAIITSPQRPPKIWRLMELANNPAQLKFRTPVDLIRHLIWKSEDTLAPVEEMGPLGTTYALIPITGETSKTWAYLVIGPLLLGSRKSRADLEEWAGHQGWDMLELEGIYQELKLFSFFGMRAILDLLFRVSNNLIQPALAKRKKERIPAKAPVSRKDTPKRTETENILLTLLSLALNATKADSGSVMVLDQETKILHIRASRGLREEIVRETRVKLGEGVAGWVAEHKHSLLLTPDGSIDSSIQNRLKRNEIDSSIVIPLSRQDRIFGVLSVNSHAKENRLVPESLNLLMELTRLTMVAI
ncbi:MAG: GAF domain-containing protein [Candidatus Omnitrophota bacterium]